MNARRDLSLVAASGNSRNPPNSSSMTTTTMTTMTTTTMVATMTATTTTTTTTTEDLRCDDEWKSLYYKKGLISECNAMHLWSVHEIIKSKK